MTYDTRPIKKQVSLSLDYDIIERLKELSYKNDRAFSQYVNFILRNEINRIDSEK